jgi:hypothetical protein
VELYDRNRFFAVTGRKLDAAPADVRPAQPALDALYRELFDPDERQPPSLAPPLVALPDDAGLLSRADAARNGPKFRRLWGGDWSAYATHSEADLALCGLLAFWTGGDPYRMDRLFRQGGLMRPKWDERRGADTYGERTIRRAVQGCRAFYGAADLSRSGDAGSPCPPKTQNRVHKSVSPGDRLLAHIRDLRLRHGRPVALSATQAKYVTGTSRATAARRLADLVDAGLLIVASKGYWDSSTGRPGPASVYDVPEVGPAPAAGPSARRTHGPQLGEPPPRPPYTRTPGGLVAVWHWSARRGQWQSYGDCTGRAAAAALAARHMPRKPGWWAVGDELRRYVRGRGLRVVRHEPGRDPPARPGKRPNRGI